MRMIIRSWQSRRRYPPTARPNTEAARSPIRSAWAAGWLGVARTARFTSSARPQPCQLDRSYLASAMHSQCQPDSLDVIGGVHAACGVTRWAGPGRGEQKAGQSAGGGIVSGAGVTVGARPLAQPLGVGPGFIRAGLQTTGQGLGEHERGGGLEFAAEQIGGAGCLEAQGPP